MKIERENITVKLNTEEVEILKKAKHLLNNIADNMNWGEYIVYDTAETIGDAVDTITAILDNCKKENI